MLPNVSLKAVINSLPQALYLTPAPVSLDLAQHLALPGRWSTSRIGAADPAIDLLCLHNHPSGSIWSSSSAAPLQTPAGDCYSRQPFAELYRLRNVTSDGYRFKSKLSYWFRPSWLRSANTTRSREFTQSAYPATPIIAGSAPIFDNEYPVWAIWSSSDYRQNAYRLQKILYRALFLWDPQTKVNAGRFFIGNTNRFLGSSKCRLLLWFCSWTKW